MSAEWRIQSLCKDGRQDPMISQSHSSSLLYKGWCQKVMMPFAANLVERIAREECLDTV
jgi:hypothetical protein